MVAEDADGDDSCAASRREETYLLMYWLSFCCVNCALTIIFTYVNKSLAS